MDKCRKFYVLTEALKDHYSKKYPNKDNYILRHGFDTPLNENPIAMILQIRIH